MTKKISLSKKSLLIIILLAAVSAIWPKTEMNQNENPKRVIALSKSVAEMWLLAGGKLVGTTEDGLDLPGTEDVLSVGTLTTSSLEAIISLNPDFVILTLDIPLHKKLYVNLKDLGIKTYIADVKNFDDYDKVISDFTDYTGRKDLYKKNVLEVKNKIQESRIREPVNVVEYKEEDIIKIAEFTVQFFNVTHSIPDSFGICVDTPEGRIVTTGDFKVDLTPVGPDINLQKMARLGTEGIDLLMSDSTNAEIEGYTPSEKNVISSINDVFAKAPGRLIISTFSSNISRIQQIVDCTIKHNRKIVIVLS